MDFEFVSPDRPSKCTWKPNGTDNPHNPDRSEPHDWRNVMPNIMHAVGQTPMVKLNNIPKNHGVKCEILAKCEFMNPGGSVKDRIAFRMVDEAERRGLLKPGLSTIIEPTSGNTGVGLAIASAAKGYRCVIVMSEKFSDEKMRTMRALGAEIVRTPVDAAWNGPDGPFAVAQRLQRQIDGGVILDQFANPENPLVHYDRTASEIWEQCKGKIDYLVGGFGTGGTLSGIGRRLRELSPSTKIVVADPRKPPREKCPDPEDQIHSVEGIGYYFVPTVTDLDVVDAHVETDEKSCFRLARELVEHEGLLCGASSGAALSAALSLAKDLPADKRVVILLPDTIRNYMSKFADDAWMESKGFSDPPKPFEGSEWWWDLTVSALPLRKPVILASDATCEKALAYLRKAGVRQVPISNDNDDEEGCGIKGFVSLDELLSRLVTGETRHSDLAVKASLVRRFKRIPKTTSLGRLSRIIRHSLYAVVLDDDDHDVVGILTQDDLYDFVCRRE